MDRQNRSTLSLCEGTILSQRLSDTFYVLEGRLRLFLQNPKQEVQLGPGESYAVASGRPHLVTNAGDSSMTILVLQGVGEYDYVPLV